MAEIQDWFKIQNLSNRIHPINEQKTRQYYQLIFKNTINEKIKTFKKEMIDRDFFDKICLKIHR